MPRPKTEDAEARLLASGLSLFARDGTERVNTNAIARRAGLGVGTFYAHFENKFALLREVQVRTLSGIRTARTAALRGVGAGARAQVEATVGAVVDFAEKHPEAYRVTFARERPGTAHHGPVMSESIRPTAEGLKRLQRRGILPETLDPDLAARAYHSMEVGTLLWWIEDPSRASKTQLMRTLATLHPALAAAAEG
ncbi:MAG: TetR/AcrR family transcriptional regulator [Myxococcota bacterium]